MSNSEPRRIEYTDQATYPGAYVVLPSDWLGEHLMRRDQALEASAAYQSQELKRACVALCLTDSWGGIPGLTGKDPATWDFKKVPVVLLIWLERTVLYDFAKVYLVPKDLAGPSSDGSTVPAIPTLTTDGNSAK